LHARDAVSSWLAANADLLPRGGRALDVACGDGRNALYLAAAGLSVRAVDRDPDRIAALSAAARRLGLDVRADLLDLESGEPDLGREAFDVVLVIHYLHRPLFPKLIGALRPGGLLLYETFTVDQALRGRPTNPAFLLRHGELPDLVTPLRVVRRREGEFEGRMVSAVAAVK
jgi:SAM-dependent methyltransferase